MLKQESKYAVVNELLGKMTIEQKVGQLFVFSLFGPHIWPDTRERILKMNCSGLRVFQGERMFGRYIDRKTGEMVSRGDRVPQGQDRDFLAVIQAPHVSVGEYAGFLNSVKRIAMERPLGIPIHLVLDQEGDYSSDFMKGGVHFFPSCMGLAASGDKELCYRVARATARQLRAIGINMIHSPVLDVNTNPTNPEIGTRSYSDDPEVCAQYAMEMLRACSEEGLIATAKHFPGRGAGNEDAHFDLPVLNLSRQRLDEIDLLPFRKLINSGLPAIMIAHTVYPILDPLGNLATVSRPIVTDLLRGELGFEGVITTDSMSMGALVKQCGDLPEACVRAVEAGADMVLLKDEDLVTVKSYQAMLEAVQSGRIMETRIDESIVRTLKMKVDMGLFENYGLVDPAKAQAVIDEPEMAIIEAAAARKAAVLVRDEAGLLPLPRDQKILLVEQLSPLAVYANDQNCHPGMLWNEMLKYSPKNVMMVEVNFDPTEKDVERVRARLDQADILVITNDFIRSTGAATYTNFIREIIAGGKSVVVVTNTPYEMTAPEDFSTVLCTHGSTPAAWRFAAKVLFGEAKPQGNVHLKRLK